eukprot:6488802-Amphidinium_carterae.1
MVYATVNMNRNRELHHHTKSGCLALGTGRPEQRARILLRPFGRKCSADECLRAFWPSSARGLLLQRVMRKHPRPVEIAIALFLVPFPTTLLCVTRLPVL